MWDPGNIRTAIRGGGEVSAAVAVLVVVDSVVEAADSAVEEEVLVAAELAGIGDFYEALKNNTLY